MDGSIISMRMCLIDALIELDYDKDMLIHLTTEQLQDMFDMYNPSHDEENRV